MSLDILLVRRWPERRPVVLSAAAAGFAGVFAASYAVDDAETALAVLYLLPVMLVALELGLLGGLTAAALAVAFVILGAALGHPTLDALGVITRSVAVVATGVIGGRFSDRMRAAHAREQRLLDSGLALSEAAAGGDLVSAVATAAARTPGADGVTVELDGATTAVRGRTDCQLSGAPIMARGVRVGQITVMHRRALGTEDRSALALLAMQAGLAADNQRLLANEREAAALGAQLRQTRDELREHRSELGHLLGAQEDERRRVAETLHENLAQALAGVLLGLRMLRREDRGDALEDVHGQVVGILDDLRDVATGLRPSSLAQLGLVPALEGLAHRVEGGLSVQADGVPEPLPEPLRTGVYRLIQDALAAARPAAPARLRVHGTDRSLDVDLRLELEDAAPLAAANAWAAVLGGSLHVEPSSGERTKLHARLPLPAGYYDARAAATDPAGKLARTTVVPGSESIAS